MITDKQMRELGFEKVKTYSKTKRNGVSSFGWRNGSFWLSIEKHDEISDGDVFQPTLRIDNNVWVYEELSELKNLLTVLKI